MKGYLSVWSKLYQYIHLLPRKLGKDKSTLVIGKQKWATYKKSCNECLVIIRMDTLSWMNALTLKITHPSLVNMYVSLMSTFSRDCGTQ